jgi:hypothetical protein
MRRALFAVVALAACTDEHYLVVTVSVRDTVHGATQLAVSATNAGGSRQQQLPLGSHVFPLKFSVATPGRTGDLVLQIQAQDASGTLVGIGGTTATIGDKTASVLLDSADFVVNTDVAGDHFLSDDFEANGFQLGAASDGTWTVGFRDDCPTSNCNLFARRFDKNGVPLVSTLAAGTNNFPVSTTTTNSSAEPAIAVGGTTTLVTWNFFDTAGVSGIACRALDPSGNSVANQASIATENAAVVSATPLSNGNFAVTWSAFIMTNPEQVRGEIVKPDCTVLAATLGTLSTNLSPHTASRPHVAASQNAILYAWVQNALSNGDVHVAAFTNGNVVIAGDNDAKPFVAHTATLEVDHVRVAPFGGGFAVVARMGTPSGMGPGQIVLYRATVAGNMVNMVGTPTLVTDQSGSDFVSDKSFGLATRIDGALLVTWHACANPDGTQCNVFARVIRPSGVPVGDAFVVPTAAAGFQTNPSATALPESFAVAWHDTSTQVAGKIGDVRARIIFPPYDDASAVLGALCGGAMQAACGTGLACGMGSDSMQRCYETCDPAGTPPLCPHGGTCSPVSGGNACTF